MVKVRLLNATKDHVASKHVPSLKHVIIVSSEPAKPGILVFVRKTPNLMPKRLLGT